MSDPEHKDFETYCDCFVYNREINKETFPFGRVEFVDTRKASGCVKKQLKNVYLLYYDSNCVAVYNEHPKDNIKLIQDLIIKFQTDTTKLSDFAKSDSNIRITIDRLCKDKTDKDHYGEYAHWRNIEYSIFEKPFMKTKDDIITTWYKWTE
jgi:hypothetical protein